MRMIPTSRICVTGRQPVTTGTAPGLADGLYLVRTLNHIGQEVDDYIAVVAETEVGGTGLYDPLGRYLADRAAAVKIPHRRSISGRPAATIGIYLIPGSEDRAVAMGRAHGFVFGAPAVELRQGRVGQ